MEGFAHVELEDTVGLLTFSINVTLDGCVDHRERVADGETHAFFTPGVAGPAPLRLQGIPMSVARSTRRHSTLPLVAKNHATQRDPVEGKSP